MTKFPVWKAGVHWACPLIWWTGRGASTICRAESYVICRRFRRYVTARDIDCSILANGRILLAENQLYAIACWGPAMARAVLHAARGPSVQIRAVGSFSCLETDCLHKPFRKLRQLTGAQQPGPRPMPTSGLWVLRRMETGSAGNWGMRFGRRLSQISSVMGCR